MEKIIADHWRGLDFYSPKLDKNPHVIVVGCGAIGSYTAFGLARLGVKKITLIDFDIVEGHNLPNQFFAESLNIPTGMFKVSVLASTIKLIVPSVEIITIPMKFEQVDVKTLYPASAIVTTVDCMEVRKNIYASVKNSGLLLLDARIGGLFANIYDIPLSNPKASEYYKSSLYSNSIVQALPCTGQSVCDVSMTVAGELVGRYRNFAMGKQYPSFHTFHDYKIGQMWIQELNPDFSIEDNPFTTDAESLAKVGM